MFLILFGTQRPDEKGGKITGSERRSARAVIVQNGFRTEKIQAPIRMRPYVFIYILERRNRFLNKRVNVSLNTKRSRAHRFSPFTTIVKLEAWRTITVSSLNTSLLNLKRRSSCIRARSSSCTTNGPRVYATVATTWVNVSNESTLRMVTRRSTVVR